MDVRTDIPAPSARRLRKRWHWEEVPIGGSFEFGEDGTKPQAVLQSFMAHLAAGKYRIKDLGGGRFRFWRLG